jgi:hypothetical protein
MLQDALSKELKPSRKRLLIDEQLAKSGICSLAPMKAHPLILGIKLERWMIPATRPNTAGPTYSMLTIDLADAI